MGTPGSGKTYEGVKLIIENLKRGRFVMTNIEGLNDSAPREGIKILTGLDDFELSEKLIFLEDTQIIELWDHVKNNALIVIDEIHDYYSNRDWNSEKNMKFISWAKRHRHFGFDMVMLTTHIEGVDKQVRSLSQWTYVYRKVDYFGKAVKNKYEVGIYCGETTSGNPFQKKVHSYDPKIFACYKSYVTDEIKEMGIKKAVNVLMKPIFYVIPFMLCFALYMLFHSSLFGGGILGIGKKKTESSSIAAVSSLPIAFKKNEPNIVEYRDLKTSDNIIPAHVKPSGVVLPVSSEEEREDGPASLSGCRQSGKIIDSEGNTILLSECGNKTIQKNNNEIVRIGKVHSDSLRNLVIAKNNSSVPLIPNNIKIAKRILN